MTRFMQTLKGFFGLKNQVRRWPSLGHVPGFTTAGEGRKAFIQTTFSILGCVAAADNQTPQAQHTVLRSFIQQAFSFSKEEEMFALQVLFRAGRAGHSLVDLLKEFSKLVSRRPEFQEALIQGMSYMAALTKGRRPQAEGYIDEACALFGISRDRARALRAAGGEVVQNMQAEEQRPETPRVSEKLRRQLRGEDEKEEAYKLLGCSPASSVSEIKARYQEIVYAIHPDRVRASGASEKKVEAARVEFTRLVKAYNRIRRDKGFV